MHVINFSTGYIPCISDGVLQVEGLKAAIVSACWIALLLSSKSASRDLFPDSPVGGNSIVLKMLQYKKSKHKTCIMSLYR